MQFLGDKGVSTLLGRKRAQVCNFVRNKSIQVKVAGLWLVLHHVIICLDDINTNHCVTTSAFYFIILVYFKISFYWIIKWYANLIVGFLCVNQVLTFKEYDRLHEGHKDQIPWIRNITLFSEIKHIYWTEWNTRFLEKKHIEFLECIYLFIYVGVLSTKIRASCKFGKCFISKLNPQPRKYGFSTVSQQTFQWLSIGCDHTVREKTRGLCDLAKSQNKQSVAYCWLNVTQFFSYICLYFILSTL